MPLNSRLLHANIAAAAVLLLLPAAAVRAQTTINLNTANGTCVAVSTGALTSETAPGSTALRANGVTLTAAQQGACNPVGGGSSSNFNASVALSGSPTPNVSYTPAVGAPFYVLWSASTDATACTLGGNFSSGITGWTLGARACTDSASCSAAHAVQVTPTAAGNYSFSVTCTNASGQVTSGAVSVPQPATPPPTPNPLTLSVPTSGNAGGIYAVTWPQMSNAASCVGTGTIGGVNQSSLGDWTTLTSVSTTGPNTRNVTIPASAAAGSQLALTLKCWNADQSASVTSSAATIDITTQVAGCPATINTTDGSRTLLVSSGISYGTYPSPIRPNVNLTEWNNLWGYNNTTATQPVAWPGVGGAAPVVRSFTRTSYIGAHFKTGASTTPSGDFWIPTYAAGPNVTMAISTQCGDFSEHLPTPGCLKTNVATADQAAVAWKLTSNNPTGSCNLQPNTDYYVNLMLTDHLSTEECAASATTCNMATVSFHN